MTSEATAAEIRTLLDQGAIDQAAALAKSRETKTIRNADIHVAWADVLEELGLAEDVILELNFAIRDDPDRLDIYPRLAEVFMDQGQAHRAAKVYSALIEREPEEPRHYQGLGQALREAKEFEKARDVYRTALENTGDSRFAGFMRELGFLDAREETPVPEPHPLQIVPQKHHLVTFTTLFAGREGVYARQWVSPTGESGYTPVQEPMTLQVAENHILGNYTIGVYPVRLDSTVNFVAFDLDVAKFAVAKAISSERAWTALMGKVHQTACRLMDLAAAQEIPMYVEDSGFKGRHCWIFLETSVQAGVAKKFGECLVSRLAPFPSEVTVELFPKQASVKRSGLGNLIKLPLGIHKRTGKRALFIEPDGSAIRDQLGLLERVAKAPRRSIFGLIQRFHQVAVAPQPASADGTGQDEPLPWEPSDSHPGLERKLPSVQEEYDLDRDPQVQTLLLKCPVLRTILDKVNRTANLSPDETMVLIHTLGHLDRGPDAVNEIFRRSVNTDPSLFLKSKLKGNPMSCPKIRSRIPETTSAVPCNCVFDSGVNLYPTPLIHVHGIGKSPEVGPLGLTVDSLQFQNLLQDYLKLRKQFREVRLLMEKYEKRLEQFFQETGVESVQTPTGKLTMVRADGGVVFNLEV